MDLQTTFYILGIIFMAVMLILVFAILIAVLVIKAKVNKVHRMIDEKVNTVKNVAEKLSMALSAFKHFAKR